MPIYLDIDDTSQGETMEDYAIHKLTIRLAGVFFAFCAFVVSCYGIRMHLMYNKTSATRRYCIRILMMIPISCLTSGIPLVIDGGYLGLTLVRQTYHAVVIHSFFLLLVEYLGGWENAKSLILKVGIMNKLREEREKEGEGEEEEGQNADGAPVSPGMYAPPSLEAGGDLDMGVHSARVYTHTHTHGEGDGNGDSDGDYKGHEDRVESRQERKVSFRVNSRPHPQSQSHAQTHAYSSSMQAPLLSAEDTEDPSDGNRTSRGSRKGLFRHGSSFRLSLEVDRGISVLSAEEEARWRDVRLFNHLPVFTHVCRLPGFTAYGALRFARYATLQFVPMRVLCCLLLIVLCNTHVAHLDKKGDIHDGFFYVAIVMNVSQLLSLYSVIWFVRAFHGLLMPIKPLIKVFCVNGCLILSLVQGLIVQRMVYAHTEIDDYRESVRFALMIQDGILCFELFVFAFLLNKFFSYTDFHTAPDFSTLEADGGILNRLLHAVNPIDIGKDTASVIRGQRVSNADEHYL